MFNNVLLQLMLDGVVHRLLMDKSESLVVAADTFPATCFLFAVTVTMRTMHILTVHIAILPLVAELSAS